MPFWKQSEDPWDRKPDRPCPQPKEPKANPLDSLKTWNEERKVKAKEKEEARRLPPEPCPWCGKEMEQGFLLGGRGSVSWYPGIYKTDFLRGPYDAGRIDVQDEGTIWGGYYKTAWLCRDCKKAVFHMPDPPEVYDPFAPQPETEETTEEEESGE